MSAAEKPPTPPILPPNYADSCLTVLDMMSRCAVMLFVDGRHQDVVAPEHVRKQHGPAMPILIGRACMLQKPIQGLEVDLQGIRGYFSFGGKDHWCDFPWPTIWRAAMDGRAVIWGDRAPGELTMHNVAPEGQGKNKSQRQRVAPGQRELRVALVKDEVPLAVTPPRSGHLNLVPPCDS